MPARPADTEVASPAEARAVEEQVSQPAIAVEAPDKLRLEGAGAVLVDDDDLELLEVVAQDARHAIQEHLGAAAGRHDDRDLGHGAGRQRVFSGHARSERRTAPIGSAERRDAAVVMRPVSRRQSLGESALADEGA